MAHKIVISIPTKDEVKENITSFWNKHKKTIVIGAGTATAAAAYVYLKQDNDADAPTVTDYAILDSDGNVLFENEEAIIEAIEDGDVIEGTIVTEQEI